MARQREWERKKDEEISRFNPFGKPGSGAPILNRNGNVISDYSELKDQALKMSPHNYFFDEFESNEIVKAYKDTNMNMNTNANIKHKPDQFLGALNAMRFPKTTFEIQLEREKKERLKAILLEQIEEKRRQKEIQRKLEKEREIKEDMEYRQYLKQHPTEIPSPRAHVKKATFATPPSFIPRRARMRRNVNVNDNDTMSSFPKNRNVSFPKTISSPSPLQSRSQLQSHRDRSKRGFFNDNEIRNKNYNYIHIPEYPVHKNYRSGSTKDNIKNFNDDNYFFQDLLNKEWHPQDRNIVKLHEDIEEKRKSDLLKKSMHPSDSVFVYDDIPHKTQDLDNDELQVLLHAFVEQE